MLFPLDDAYITLHNAKVLLTGLDPNYGVPALVGATSPIHLAILAALGLILPLPLASLGINIAGAAGYAVGLWILSGLCNATRPARLAMLGFGLAAAIPHLVNGLETSLALAVIAWTLGLAARGSTVALPILLGALPFIRPDMAPWTVALIVWRAYRAGLDGGDWRFGARRFMLDAGLALIAAAPWLIWTWVELGTPLPSTVLAKRAFFAEEGLPLGEKITLVIANLFGSFMGPALLALVAGRRAPLFVPVSVALAVFLVAYTVTFPGGLAHANLRYLAVFAPFCIYGAAYAAVEREQAVKVGLLGLIIILTPLGAWRLSRSYALAAEGGAATEWARDHLPTNARLLLHDAGLPAYMTDLRLIDVVGLKSPSSIPDNLRWSASTAGRERDEAVNHIALEAGATHAIVLDDPFWSGIAGDLRRHGWTLRVLRQPTASPGFWIYALSPPALDKSTSVR